MKFTKPHLVLGFLCAAIVLSAFSSTAEARIGESRSNLEQRLLDSGGLAYRDEEIIEARRQGMPYEDFLDYVVSRVDVQVYYKPASVDSKALRSKFNAKRTQPGWELHVVYANGKSVLEIYQRNPGMTEQELNMLLILQANGQRWKKVDPADLVVGEELPDSTQARKALSAFGYEMLRNDGAVRAKNYKNGLLFVDAEMDAKFAIARDEDRNSSAPDSVRGF